MRKIIRDEKYLPRVLTLSLKNFHKCIAILIAVLLVPVAVLSAPARAPKITLVYTTAETSTSAAVVWNTNTASDSLLQYSTTNPVPGSAPQVYVSTQVTYHDIPLSGLTPGTLYFYRVTSCNRKGCVTATGSFETSPSCPDVVSPLSGRWEKVTSPNVAGATSVSNELFGVAAVSENNVWAVGWSQDPLGPPYVQRTLIQHFNGSTWNIVQSPNPSKDIQSVLYSVFGKSADNVWAVGSSNNGSAPTRTLIQHWDGTQWTIVPSPSPDSQLNELRSVTALSADNAWAVGYRGGTQNETPLETLILHWDGARWRQVQSPNVPVGANQLSGITAISADDIWAVGSAGGAPLTMHWDGNAWSVVHTGVSGGLITERFTAVSGTAGDDVWAVGQGKGFFTNQTFATIRHWDGTHWTQKVCYAASASNPPEGYEGGGPDAYFTGIAAAANNDVWAVGVRGSGPMILHWDGQAWTTVTHPRAFPNAATLRAVTTSVGGNAWSVGIEIEVSPSGSVTPERTLINRYSP